MSERMVVFPAPVFPVNPRILYIGFTCILNFKSGRPQKSVYHRKIVVVFIGEANVTAFCILFIKNTQAVEKPVAQRTEIVLPAGVSEIGQSAFYGCSSLLSVVMPEAIEVVEEMAFYGCSKLKSLALGKQTRYVGDKAFANTARLTNLYCYATVPPEAKSTSFGNLKLLLHVPYSARKAYKANAAWKVLTRLDLMK